jgi:DoxX-like family
MVFTTINRREATGFVYANVPSSRGRRRTGAVLSVLAMALLLIDSVGRLIGGAQVIEGSAAVIGMILIACVIAYLVPRTSVLGAILLTGYLGGAVATRFVNRSPLLTDTLFPVYIGALVWGGLILREERLHALVPLRR